MKRKATGGGDAATAFRNDFFDKYPDLLPNESLVDAVAVREMLQAREYKGRFDFIRQHPAWDVAVNLQASGFRGGSREAVMETIAKAARQELARQQHGPRTLDVARVMDHESTLCRRCSKRLEGVPTITVEGYPYCYICAKVIVPTIEQERQRAARLEYDQLAATYNAEKNAFEERHRQWVARRCVAIRPKTWTNGASSAGAIAGAAIGCAAVPGAGLIIGGIIGLFIGSLLSNSEDQRLQQAFDATNPEPTFARQPPPFATIKPVTYYPVLATTQPESYDRDAILNRDSHTCQNCGKRKQKKNLEVHHVIPCAKGGSHDPTNLITLCIRCHDRETWFGHVRVNPTTLPKPKPYRTRSYWRPIY